MDLRGVSLATPCTECSHPLNLHQLVGHPDELCLACASCPGYKPDRCYSGHLRGCEHQMARDAGEPRQCSARHGQKLYLRCQEEVTTLTMHTGDHWGIDRDGQTLHWTDLVAMYPAIDGNFRPVGAANPDRTRFETKDSGARAEYSSGMVRDTDSGKARFELLLPLGVPYSEQFLVRVAELMARGAEKYDSRNWEKAQGDEEMERFKSSALRHLMQWAAGETDEDHAAAVVFNLLGFETTRWRRGQG